MELSLDKRCQRSEMKKGYVDTFLALPALIAHIPRIDDWPFWFLPFFLIEYSVRRISLWAMNKSRSWWYVFSLISSPTSHRFTPSHSPHLGPTKSTLGVLSFHSSQWAPSTRDLLRIPLLMRPRIGTCVADDKNGNDVCEILMCWWWKCYWMGSPEKSSFWL